ncbi:hypothetical protein F5Y00DRAFT_116023 [Daldinia vernicosa]|uniref:uncharacterized protein n=1 Tax=Daldinia vernicosa TaxID=114800 RepID=UPI002008642C|nr:uncharacterized protein F5Y00DRAFT_116023 [Daldinia vernicosa]KAI0847556.1 hypothetical protein F5Y00DRAFT_116023 [Daldinia vernicosa]
MFHKTAAALGLVAVSGAAAGSAGGYPAYPVNNTAPAPSSVWQYYNTTVPTTVVVPQFTTVCPEATTLSYNGVQYTVTKGETVTVTDCPCTVPTVVHTLTSSLCPPGVTPTAVVPAVPTGVPYPAETPAPGTPGTPAVPGAPGAPGAPGSPGKPGSPAAGTTLVVPAPAGTTPAPGAPAQGGSGGSPPAGAAPAEGTSGAAPVANTPNPPAGTAGYTPSAVPSGIAVSGAGSSNSGFAAALFAAFLGVVAL